MQYLVKPNYTIEWADGKNRQTLKGGVEVEISEKLVKLIEKELDSPFSTKVKLVSEKINDDKDAESQGTNKGEMKVEAISGVGAASVTVLNGVGIETVQDLVDADPEDEKYADIDKMEAWIASAKAFLEA